MAPGKDRSKRRAPPAKPAGTKTKDAPSEAAFPEALGHDLAEESARALELTRSPAREQDDSAGISLAEIGAARAKEKRGPRKDSSAEEPASEDQTEDLERMDEEDLTEADTLVPRSPGPGKKRPAPGPPSQDGEPEPVTDDLEVDDSDS